jgi:hypothetical protein
VCVCVCEHACVYLYMGIYIRVYVYIDINICVYLYIDHLSGLVVRVPGC